MLLEIAGATLWLIMMVVTAAVREKNLKWNEYMQEGRFIGHFFFGLIWPLYLGVWGLGALGKCIAEGNLKMPRLPRRVKQNEIAQGIPCPIDVLAQMAKASLLKDFRLDYDHIKNDRVDLYAYCFNSNISRAEVVLRVGEVTLKTEELPDYVRLDLIEFYKQMLITNRARVEAEQLAEIRNRALTGVESLLSIDKD